MKNINLLIIVCILVLVTGCAKNYVRPASEALRLGKSSNSDVIKLMGEPTFKNDKLEINNEKIQTLSYFYFESAKFWGLISPQRTLTYTFFNDLLIGEEFNSSFPDEKSEFDTTRITQIIKGKSTRNDVIAILGKPAGEILYPLVKEKNGHGIIYEYTYTRFAGVFSPTYRQLLIVALDENELVTEIIYKVDGKEQAPT